MAGSPGTVRRAPAAGPTGRTGSHVVAAAPHGGCGRSPAAPGALTGSADLALFGPMLQGPGASGCLRNSERAGGQSSGIPGGAARYSGGGRRLRSFISSSPFQYLKLLSRCCINSGRSTKAGEKDRDVVSFPASGDFGLRGRGQRAGASPLPSRSTHTRGDSSGRGPRGDGICWSLSSLRGAGRLGRQRNPRPMALPGSPDPRSGPPPHLPRAPTRHLLLGHLLPPHPVLAGLPP